MKFRRLAIPAYGPFTDLALEFSTGQEANSADFHLIYGRNEAGKSSLLRAIRDLLYGIHAQTADNFVHDYKDLRITAEIENRSGQVLAFQRRKGNRNTLLDAAGNPLADDVLAPFLGPVDREFFTTMFGLGSDELRQGAYDLLQGKGDLGQALFSASLAGTPIHRVLERLEAEARTLFDGKAWKNASIRPAVDTYEEALRLCRQAQVKAETWEDALRELETAQHGKAELDASLHSLRGRQDWLRRCLDALPTLGRLRETETSLNALPPLPAMPAGFAEGAESTRNRLAQAEQTLGDLQRRLGDLVTRRDSLAPRAAVLAHAAEIDVLVHGLAVYRQGRDALAAETTEAEQLQTGLRAGLLGLGLPVEPGDIADLRIPLAEELALREAAEALKQAELASEEHRREGERLAAELEKTTARLRRLPPSEAAALRDAYAASAAAAALALALPGRDAALESHARRLASQHAVLPGAPADPEATAALALPAAARLREFAAAATDQSTRARQLDEAIVKTAKALRELKAKLERLEKRGALPSHDDLAQARGHREEGWRQVLACWRKGAPEQGWDGAPLDESYPAAVRHADTLADRLREEADAVAQAEELRWQIQDAEATSQGQQAERRRLEQARQTWENDWSALWRPTGLIPASPAEMLEWREQWNEFRSRHEAWRELRDELQAAQQSIAAAEALLRPLLAACRTLVVDSENEPAMFRRSQNRPQRGQFLPDSQPHSRTMGQKAGEKWTAAVNLQPTIPKSDRLLDAAAQPLLELREMAERRLRAADQVLGERRALEDHLAELHSEAEILARRRTTLDAALARAQTRWRAHPLAGEYRPETALRLLEARLELVAQYDAWTRLSAELAEQQNAVATYERQAQALADIAGETSALPAEVQVNALREALFQARALQARRGQVEEDLAQLAASLPRAEQDMETARREMVALLAQAGVADLPALQGLLVDLALRQGLAAERDNLRAALHVPARGEALDRFIERVRGEGGADLAAELEDLAGHIKEQEVHREQAIQNLARAEDARARLESSGDHAAEYLQTARHASARIRQDVARYLRLRLATQFLQVQIEAFRERNQGPLLVRAGELFRRMTGASFSGLGTGYAEDDTPLLVGLKNTGPVPVEGMSEGTRDQLYLALRLAAIELHQARHEPMPLILDDLLITFDDDRARAILPMLCDLAGTTQVLLFTHHRHLLDLARQTLPAAAVCLHELA